MKLKSKEKNNTLHKDNIYNNNALYYKFQGLPISGYKGHIPKIKLFFGISTPKIIKIIYDNGLYLKDNITEKEYNLIKKIQ